MTKLPRVFVTRRLPKEILSQLDAHAHVDLWDSDLPPDSESLIDHVREADGLLCLLTDRVDKALIQQAESLRIISNMAVGTDNIDLSFATAQGIPVGNTPGVLTETTADFAFALLMAAARRVVDGDRYVRDGRWQTWGPSVLLGQDIFGKTLGIIGYGAIGRAVARRAQGFSMNVVYNSRSEKYVDENTPANYAGLEDLLGQSDFVSLHVPLTDETRHMISSKELALMKDTAILINTARGSVIDQDALVVALRDHSIAMAALDVTTVEPIAIGDPLLSLPNVIVTPHIASASTTTRRQMAQMAVDNLLAGLHEDVLPHFANPEVYSQ
ncbi:D-glycerate dehydrogenase [Dehalococcoidia bacterium]|nr:D-glycerate dehydrogenase [Dehalococcoidia bacterium]